MLRSAPADDRAIASWAAQGPYGTRGTRGSAQHRPVPGARSHRPERSLRIAIVGPSWHALREPYAGGQESLVATLSAMLRARGHHVLLYARPGTDPRLADELVPMPDLPRLSAVAALDAQLPEPAFLRDQHAYTAVMSDLIGRDDIDAVLNHSLHALPLTLSTLLARPVVTTLHTPPLPWMEMGAALAGPNASYVAVSAALARAWTTLAAPHVIGNGVRTRSFAFGSGGPDLVWVGRITPEKGTHLAIDAARLAGRRLALLGPVSDRDYYEQQVLPRLGRTVRYLGHLDHQAAARIVGASAVALVTPMWDEPFGLVAAEALMCGTPVVALARGGLPEVVGDAGVLVAADDATPQEQLVAGLARGITRAEGLDRREVHAWAVHRHSADRMVAEYEELLRRLVPPRGRRAASSGSSGAPGSSTGPASSTASAGSSGAPAGSR